MCSRRLLLRTLSPDSAPQKVIGQFDQCHMEQLLKCQQLFSLFLPPDSYSQHLVPFRTHLGGPTLLMLYMQESTSA